MAVIVVEEKAVIQNTAENIFNVIKDFDKWHTWAPWLISDPQAYVTPGDDGRRCKWEGRAIGTGQIRRISASANREITVEILFVDPKPMRAVASFKLVELIRGTRLTFRYEQSFSWFKSLWKRNLANIANEVSFDFKRGLKNVNDLATGRTLGPGIELAGVHRRFGYEYLGIHRTIPIDEIDEVVQEDFKELIPYSKANIPERDRPWPFIIYHKWDLENYTVEITSCVSILEIPETIPEGMIHGRTEDTRVFSIMHYGDHRHISNAWRTLYYMKKANLIDVNESIGYEAMEYFREGPLDVHRDEIRSDLIIPLNEVDVMSEKVYVSR